MTDLEGTHREARFRTRHTEAFLEGRQHAHAVHPHRVDDKDDCGKEEGVELDVGAGLETARLVLTDTTPCVSCWRHVMLRRQPADQIDFLRVKR